MATIVRTEGLCKRYGARVAVDALNLSIDEGEIYGFLGPNGAGKTTTLMMLLGLEQPTSGRVTILGHTLEDAYFDLKRRIGVVSETPRPYPDMTAVEYLAFFGTLFGVKHPKAKAEDSLREIHLYEHRHKLVRHYSRGMLQKLELARALLHEPDLLILDEPVSGLDPHGLKEVRELICAQRTQGRTVLISSHILSEIEKTADKIGILNHGRLVAEDDIATIVGRLQGTIDLEVELDEHKEAITRSLSSLGCVVGLEKVPRGLLIHARAGGDHRKEIAQAIGNAGGLILSLSVHSLSLEEAFIRITDNNVAQAAGGDPAIAPAFVT
ncbi:MAG: ABC transporter ATP-binding protein [Chloroflexota bacterium]